MKQSQMQPLSDLTDCYGVIIKDINYCDQLLHQKCTSCIGRKTGSPCVFDETCRGLNVFKLKLFDGLNK